MIEVNIMKILPQQLKELRARKKITQEELAQKIGSSRANVSSWEIGRAEPDNDTLIKIAEFFGVTTDYLLGKNSPNEIKSFLSPDALELAKRYDDIMTPELKEEITDYIKYRLEREVNKKKR
jgi:transcriptional regulator with XRE-family HTH domain